MIRIPGTKKSLRFFDPVETADEQYNVYDIGVQHDDGGIDSMVVGGSFYSLKKAISNLNDKVDSAPEAA